MDFALVLIGVIDSWILTPLLGQGSFLSNLMILRVARFARVVRLVRLLSLFKEMWLIVAGLVSATRTLIWVFILLCTTLYVCGILSTMVFGQSQAITEPPAEVWDREYLPTWDQ